MNKISDILRKQKNEMIDQDARPLLEAMLISKERIMSIERTRFVTNRRMVLVYHLIMTYGYSNNDVCNWMKRDHTSTIYLKRQYDNWIHIYDDLKNLNKRVEDSIGLEKYMSKA